MNVNPIIVKAQKIAELDELTLGKTQFYAGNLCLSERESSIIREAFKVEADRLRKELEAEIKPDTEAKPCDTDCCLDCGNYNDPNCCMFCRMHTGKGKCYFTEDKD
jgi:hypothetical protein